MSLSAEQRAKWDAYANRQTGVGAIEAALAELDRLQAENEKLTELCRLGAVTGLQACESLDRLQATADRRGELLRRARALADELFDAYVAACWQGSGEEPLSSPTWHMFMSVWEEADELIPRARTELAAIVAELAGEGGGT